MRGDVVVRLSPWRLTDWGGRVGADVECRNLSRGDRDGGKVLEGRAGFCWQGMFRFARFCFPGAAFGFRGRSRL